MKSPAMAPVTQIRLKSEFQQAVGDWLENNIHEEVSKCFTCTHKNKL